MADTVKEPERIRTATGIRVGPSQSRLVPRVSIQDSASEYESDAEIFFKQITVSRSPRSVSALVEPNSGRSSAFTPSPTRETLGERKLSENSMVDKSPRTQFLRHQEGGELQKQMSHLVQAFRARSLQARTLVTQPTHAAQHHSSITTRRISAEILAAGLQEEFPNHKRRTSGASVRSAAVPLTDSLVTFNIGRFHLAVPEFFINKVPRPNPMDHHSYVYLTWLAVLTLAFVYNAGAIPFRAAFCDPTDPYQPLWLACDYICDFLYIIDVIIWRASVTAPIHGIEVSDRRDIIRSYVSGWDFRLDMMCLVPFDLLYFIPAVKMNPLLRCNRLLKVRTYWEFLDLVDQISTNPYYFRILRTFSYMMYIIHINACLYYYYSYLHSFDADDDFVFNNVHPKCQGLKPGPKCNFPGNYNEYVFCLFFSVSMITIIGNLNFPGTVSAILYSALLWFVGVFIFATLVGQIRDVLKAKTRQEDEFFELMDAIIEHMKTLKIPKDLQDRVRSWLLFNWEQQKTTDEREMLRYLPTRLRTDLAMEVHYSTIHKVHLFRNLEKQAVEELLLRLRPCVFLPGDFICRKGEIGKEMYIVKSGTLEVVLPDGRAAVTLGAGSVFGEISLMAEAGGNRRTADVRAKGFATLYILTKSDLAQVLQDYPDQMDALKTKAHDMLKKDIPPTSGQPAHDPDLLPPVEIIRQRSRTPDMIRIALRALNKGRNSRVSPVESRQLELTDMVNLSAGTKPPPSPSKVGLLREPDSFPPINVEQTSPTIPVSPQNPNVSLLNLSTVTVVHVAEGLVTLARTHRRRSRSRSSLREPPPSNDSSDNSSDDDTNRWLRPVSNRIRRRNSSKTSLEFPTLGTNLHQEKTKPSSVKDSGGILAQSSQVFQASILLSGTLLGNQRENVEPVNVLPVELKPNAQLVEPVSVFRSPNLRHLKATKFGRTKRITPLIPPRTPRISSQVQEGDNVVRGRPREAKRWNIGVFELGAVPQVMVGEPGPYLSSDMDIFNSSDAADGDIDFSYISENDSAF